jgi:hypothetical protein
MYSFWSARAERFAGVLSPLRGISSRWAAPALSRGIGWPKSIATCADHICGFRSA